MVHGRDGYEVEFMTLDGETIAVTSLHDNEMRSFRRREIAHARGIKEASNRQSDRGLAARR